jgi:hypothetical protein
MTLPRGRALRRGKHDQVVNYRHVIHSLRSKPMALLNLVYRDQLFPARPIGAFDDAPGSARCRRETGLPHHGRASGALPMSAAARPNSPPISTPARGRQLPDMAACGARFAPDPAALPDVVVHLAPLNLYEALIGAGPGETA